MMFEFDGGSVWVVCGDTRSLVVHQNGRFALGIGGLSLEEIQKAQELWREKMGVQPVDETPAGILLQQLLCVASAMGAEYDHGETPGANVARIVAERDELRARVSELEGTP